jgi:hypothetical protein
MKLNWESATLNGQRVQADALHLDIGISNESSWATDQTRIRET